MSAILFYPLAALTVAGALGVVLAKNPVRSALSLVLTLFLLAVFYAFLQAHLVAALQIIVYTGAVMVLFLFVITLLNLESDGGAAERPALAAVGFGAGGIVALLLAKAVLDSEALRSGVQALPEGFGTTKVLARQLFNEYLVAFELTSVLLLVAVVGAVVLAKRTIEQDDAALEGMVAAADEMVDAAHAREAAVEADHAAHGEMQHGGHGPGHHAHEPEVTGKPHGGHAPTSQPGNHH